jgi:hypothetical protein
MITTLALYVVRHPQVGVYVYSVCVGLLDCFSVGRAWSSLLSLVPTRNHPGQ